jgi:hypothetical protein
MLIKNSIKLRHVLKIPCLEVGTCSSRPKQARQSARDLVAQVAGYSAYSVRFGKLIQNEVVGRTEFDKAI